MKRTKVKLFAGLFLFAAFLFVQDVQAQSFAAGDVSQLSAKSGLNESDFHTNDDAISILKAEVNVLASAASNLNGGSIEAENNLRTHFYMGIFESVSTGEATMEAISSNVADLISHASAMDVPVSTQVIIDDAIALLAL